MLQNDPLRFCFHTDADPDPAFHSDADPDPAAQNKADRVRVHNTAES